MQQDNTIPQSDPNSANQLSQPVKYEATLPPPKQTGGDGWKSVISTLIILLAAPIVALLLTAYVFQSYEVDGASMETTLENHDRLIVLKVPRTLAEITGKEYIPHRGDIIVFTKRGLTEFGDAQAEKQLIKRVIGLPGDRVIVQDGKITIINRDHPTGFSPDFPSRWSNAIVTTPGNVDLTVPAGHVYVCGDNRTNSLDSRYFGAIEVKDIVGKLALRVYPFGGAQEF